MKKGLRVLLEVFLMLTGILLVLVFLAFSAKSEIVPDIYVTSGNDKVALAVRGGYTWTSFSESKIADSVAPQDYVYKNNNVLLVTPQEKMIFRNSDNPLSQYKFYPLEMKYYDDKGKSTIVTFKGDTKTYADLKSLEVTAPIEEGTYIYNFRLSYYNNGEVSYGLKVVVSAEPNYEITELAKYRNTSLKDIASIQEVLNLLPYAKYKNNVVIRTNSSLTELQIDYKTLAVEKEELLNNTIALFTLIPELDWITYKTENESVVYTRVEIENYVGRNLSDYADDIELWKQEILFKEPNNDEKTTRNEIYELILKDILSDGNSGDRAMLIVDTKSFAENEILELSNVDRQEILEYASNFSNTVYDMSKEEYDRIRSRDMIISLSSIRNSTKIIEVENESGDKIQEEEIINGKYICEIIILQRGKLEVREYQIEYDDIGNENKWKIEKL